MSVYNRKAILNCLNEIESHIVSNYDIIDCEYYTRYEKYDVFRFKLKTYSHNVVIEFRKNLNSKCNNVYMHIEFKNPRPQRRSGITTGYCNHVGNAMQGIFFNIVDKELKNIIDNIDINGIWCDESRYDD